MNGGLEYISLVSEKYVQEAKDAMEPLGTGVDTMEDDADFAHDFDNPSYFLQPTGDHGPETNIANGAGSSSEADGGMDQVSLSFHLFDE